MSATAAPALALPDVQDALLDAEPPDVQDALLDAELLARLFSDLELGADVREIVYKRAAEEADATAGPLDLAAARDALLAGRVLGVQIRYLHEGRRWCDTLLPTPAGVRLVRIEQS
jgi:hypothetical protein